MTQPSGIDPADQNPESGWLRRLRSVAMRLPGLRAVFSAMDAGLGEILIVVLLLIAMPLALLLIVGAFQFGGLPGGFLFLGVVAAAVVVWLVRSRRS